LAKWRLGYAPDVWQGLSDFLSSRGYTEKEIEKAGVGLTSQKGSFYDRFRGRIIFPIFDLNSQIIGFGGRVFKDKDKQEVAKYVNTPQTMLYDKSRVLYGLDKAKLSIRKNDVCVLVEGYMDAIMSVQAGVENTVATSGTALTPFQLQILKRYSNNILTAFDMDIAGNSATKRGIDLAQSQGFNVKVVTMPGEKDPADVVQKNAEDWPKLVAQTKSILEFYFDSAFAGFDSASPEGKREISKILLPVIKRIPNKIEQAHWIQELSRRLGVKEEVVEEELKKTKVEELAFLEKPLMEPVPLSASLNRKELLEEKIASLVLNNPKNLSLIPPEYLYCFSPKIQIILTSLKENKVDQKDEFINYLCLKAEAEEEMDGPKEVVTCLRELKVLEFKEKLDVISQEIKKAEAEKDSQKINDLSQKFRDLAKELNIL
jgi:DNA primase